jgi:hypothetical protein
VGEDDGVVGDDVGAADEEPKEPDGVVVAGGAAPTALQVKTVGRTREETAARAVAEAPSRSPERMRDCTRLWRLRRGSTKAEVVSGRWGPLGSRGGGESRRRAWSGGSMRRRRSAAASSADEKAKWRRRSRRWRARAVVGRRWGLRSLERAGGGGEEMVGAGWR